MDLLRYSFLLRVFHAGLDLHPVIKLFPEKAVIRLRITVGLGAIGFRATHFSRQAAITTFVIVSSAIRLQC